MENPSPTLPEPPVVADFDALVRAARQERCLSENTLSGVPTGVAAAPGVERSLQARSDDAHPGASRPVLP